MRLFLLMCLSFGLGFAVSATCRKPEKKPPSCNIDYSQPIKTRVTVEGVREWEYVPYAYCDGTNRIQLADPPEFAPEGMLFFFTLSDGRKVMVATALRNAPPRPDPNLNK